MFCYFKKKFKLNELTNSVTTEQQESLNTLLLCSKQIENVVNDLLKLNKLEFKDTVLQQNTFTLSQLVNVTFSTIRTRAVNKHIELLCKTNIPLEIVLIGDFKKITEIINNFLTNAIKFTEKGSIKLFIRKEKEISPNIIQFHFAVQDTGIGISSEQITKIFKPYCQADQMIESKYGGTGLGLNIVNVLINQLNKNYSIKNIIGVTSEENVGSTFWIRVCFQVSMECSSIKKSLSSIYSLVCDDSQIDLIKNKNLQILVAEDNFINQKIILKLLVSLNCNVHTVTNGQYALDYFTQNKNNIHLIFMDIQMPKMNGCDATQKIRLIDTTIPIIGCTGNCLQEEITYYLSIGMNDVIIKPFDKQKLCMMLLKYV